jgi:hypothetical protein
MFINKVIIVLTVILYTSITGCVTIDRAIRDPYIAGVADVVTTEIGVAHGLVEMNPIGPLGAYMFKGLYLFVLRPDLTEQERVENDRIATSLWWGAAVNNFISLVAPGMALSAGLISGFSIYQYQLLDR